MSSTDHVLPAASQRATSSRRIANDVSAYSVNAVNGTLTQIPCVVPPGSGCSGDNFLAGIGPVSVTLDSSAKYVYVANSGSNDVSAYSVNAVNGTLTQIPCGPGCNGNNFMAGLGPVSVITARKI